MDFDNYVQQPQRIYSRIRHQLEEAEKWKSLSERASAVYGNADKVQKSLSNNHEFWLTKYIDSKNRVTALMLKYDEVADSIREWLYQNLSMEDASMLEFRFLDGMSNAEIAEQMKFSIQTVKNKISKAVRNARELYNSQKEGESWDI